MQRYRCLIIGGGVAAGYAAQIFAEEDVEPGELGILSAEDTLPYERPPLSKGFLAGETNTGEILINPPDFYDENQIDVHLNSRVARVDLEKKEVATGSETFGYEKLMIATGARVRRFGGLTGADLDHICYLRQVEDSKRIRELTADATEAAVIGGSFIGMETTAVLQSQGVKTTMLFPEERVWQAFFTPEMSAFFADYYRGRGVTIMPGQEIGRFEGNGRVNQVVLKSGQTVKADLVVAGIGVQPNSDLFQDTGLQIEGDGILVNRYLETNVPDVYAVGDVARYRDLLFDRTQRIEHWDNAVAQGRHAARGMLGQREKFLHVPFFFSDEFDLSYEFWGDTANAVQTVHRGQVEEGRFSAWWLGENGRLLAAFVMDRPDDEREAAPALIRSGQSLTPELLTDEEQSLVALAEEPAGT